MAHDRVPIELITQRWYKIRHRTEGKNHDLMSVMQYLGISGRPGPVSHRFNARPVARIQTLRHTTILSVEEVPATDNPIVGYRWTELPAARTRAQRNGTKARKRPGRQS